MSDVEPPRVGQSKKRALRTVSAVWVLMMVGMACGGSDAIDVASDRRHVVGGDLLLVMESGQGVGEFADGLLSRLRRDGFGGVVPGSADHLAFFESSEPPGPGHPGGVVDFVTYRRPNPQRGEADFCLSWGAAASCQRGLPEPGFLGQGTLFWGFEAAAFGGKDLAEAVFVTESANTVSVLAVRGYAYAEWQEEWGPAARVEFYDAAGSLMASVEFPTED